MKTSRKHFKTVDEYIKTFSGDVAERLEIIRSVIKKHAPQATEGISYNIPAFKLNGIFLYFAGFAQHVSIYPYSASMKLTPKEVAVYRKGKGTLQFSLSKKLPVALIRKVVKNKLKEQLAKKR